MANRLQHEKNPYLLQHANNPVDWFPWCEEAFEKAKEADKPVFLSIGYSTCHWCHVMQHESFEDDEVADMMNSSFINIKLDREEHPDIDAMYMTACQMVTGGGGWPLTVIMTADKKPFFLGTYFPKESTQNRIGMIDLIQRINEIWDENRSEIVNSSEEILKNLIEQAGVPFGDSPDEKLLHAAYEQFEKRFDPQFGGFGSAPKFPTPHNLVFLLRYHHYCGNEKALVMAERTLTALRSGGIFDHLGKGFHRYSTDRQWVLPHFEKMLYDQAMLMIAFTEAYSVTGKSIYRDSIEDIYVYVSENLLSPEGAFYSAEDADSEGIEGKYYVWTADELQTLLAEDYPVFSTYFNISPTGNFQDPFNHMVANSNILFRTLEQTTAPTSAEDEATIQQCMKKLVLARTGRVKPFKDDKILTDWNGLMIAALAFAGRVINEPKYIAAAEDAANFIFEKMSAENMGLYHRYHSGQALVHGMIEDYAFFMWGLIELYQSTFKLIFLEKALGYSDKVITDFKDQDSAGFFFTDKKHEKIPVRQKEVYDGAIPSANSVMITNLITLSHLTGESGFDHEANLTLRAFSSIIVKSPSMFTQYLSGLMHALQPHTEIVIAGDKQNGTVKRFLREVIAKHNPYLVLMQKDATNKESLNSIAPFTEGMISLYDEPTFYICKDFTCKMPVTRVDEALDLI